MELAVLFLILIPLITAFFIPLFDLFFKGVQRFLVIAGVLGELLLSLYILISNYEELISGKLEIEYHLGGWSPAIGISLIMDNLSLIFSLLIAVTMFFIVFYSIGFIGHHEDKYYVLLFLIIAAMQGTVLTGDIFNMYVFVELVTITSAALVAFNRNREGTEAALKYMIYGVIGGLFFLLAVVLTYYNLGSLNMVFVIANFRTVNPVMKGVIAAFFLTAIFMKAGIFPFHFWLPKAHSSCPGPVSALLSGVLLKVFLYIFLRFFWQVYGYAVFIDSGVNNLIIYLALFSSTIGHLLALREDDIKRMLAFSSIGHIGMIAAVIALNTPSGLFSGLLHIISHLLMKSTLFLIVGYLLQFTESHHIADFNGVAYRSPAVFAAFIISAAGMIGIPPLPGFFSKYYVIQAFIEAGRSWAGVLIVLLSIISLFYYLRYIFRAYDLLDYEKGRKPVKPNLVFSEFYRERIVTAVVYVFTGLEIISGIFIRVFNLPLIRAIQVLLRG